MNVKRVTALRVQYGFFTLLLFLSLSLATERQAHAYVDPGSSLLIIQSLGALASGAAFYFRRRVKKLFTRRGVEPVQEAVDPR